MNRLFRRTPCMPLSRPSRWKWAATGAVLLACGSLMPSLRPTPVLSHDGLCAFDRASGQVVFARMGNAPRAEFTLDLPDSVELVDPRIVCSDELTVIVTSRYAIRTLGAGEVRTGKQMLGGFRDGSFYPQNAILFDLAPLGRVISASISDRTLLVTAGSGDHYAIDLDRPSRPATRIVADSNRY